MAKLLVKGLTGILDLAHVKVTNTADGITLVDDSGSLALGTRKDDIKEIAKRRDRLDTLKVVLAAHQ